MNFSGRFTFVVAAAMLQLSACSVSQGTPEGRDLNRNGVLDPYEDSRLSSQERVDDLLARMTLEEKAGTVMHGTLPAVDSPIGISTEGYDFAAVEQKIDELKITSFVTGLRMGPAELAEMNNRVQEIAGRGRLGIPVTISSDPKHHLKELIGASSRSTGFSVWPETLGLAALGNEKLVKEFGDIVRQDYRAVGIHMALSPQADLATEPRWPRIYGTYGSDPVGASDLVGAYIEGLQGGSDGVTRKGVASVVKHWVGYSAAVGGYDAHNYYGRMAAIDSESFELHVRGFRGAFDANVAGVMPSYAVIENLTVDGQAVEEIGGGFSRVLLTDVLRDREGFDGFVLTDWAILNDCPEACVSPTAENPQTPMSIGMPWGLEDQTRAARARIAMLAGVDQFGGFEEPSAIIASVNDGSLPEARLDEAVAKVLFYKFELGLFDGPFVDPAQAELVIGNVSSFERGAFAQRAAHVLLQNTDAALPISSNGRKVWIYGIDPQIAEAAGFDLVNSPEEADLALMRFATPSEVLHPHHFFANFQREGRLDFRAGDEALDLIEDLPPTTPLIIGVDMDRPAILTNLRDRADGIFAIFGASDDAFLDVVQGKAQPLGNLPFNLPATWEAVEEQDPGRPNDDRAPLFPVGFGLRYSN